jgi:hypothetical protein
VLREMTAEEIMLYALRLRQRYDAMNEATEQDSSPRKRPGLPTRTIEPEALIASLNIPVVELDARTAVVNGT